MNTGIYYYKLIQQRRAKPQDDMISRLIETEIERDGQVEKLTDVDIAGFATMLGGAGAETVTKLVGNAMVAFADFPDEWQKLRGDRSKIPAAVEELLRYEAPSQYQVRTATSDVTLHGTTIPEGGAVLLVTGSATRDERMFPDPDRVDIDRHRKMGFNLALGYGVHSCLGAALARMESRIAFEALLDLIPVPAGGWALPFVLALIWILPRYLYRSMKIMYGQSGLLTLLKFNVLVFAYLLCGSFMVLATALVSVEAL